MFKRIDSTFDEVLFFVAIILLQIGIVMIYSSSTILAAENFNDPYLFLKKDIIWVVLGISCILLFMNIDYYLLRKYIYPLPVSPR